MSSDAQILKMLGEYNKMMHNHAKKDEDVQAKILEKLTALEVQQSTHFASANTQLLGINKHLAQLNSKVAKNVSDIAEQRLESVRINEVQQGKIEQLSKEIGELKGENKGQRATISRTVERIILLLLAAVMFFISPILLSFINV